MLLIWHGNPHTRFMSKNALFDSHNLETEFMNAKQKKKFSQLKVSRKV